MGLREYRTRSHEASVSVSHHADKWLLALQRRTAIGCEVLLCDQLNWSCNHGTRPTARQSAGRVAETVVARP